MKLKSQGPGYQNCNSEIDHIKVPNVLEFQNSSLRRARKTIVQKYQFQLIPILIYSVFDHFKTFKFKGKERGFR